MSLRSVKMKPSTVLLKALVPQVRVACAST